MSKDIFPTRIPIIGRVRICLEILERLNLSGKTIVDVGCSFGWLEQELIKYPKVKLIGIDPDDKAIEHAKKRLKRKAQFIVGDALSMPLKDNSIDFVAFLDVIEHLPKGKEYASLQEVKRVLKNGGIIFLTTPNNHILSNLLDPAWYFGHRHYTKKDLSRLLTRSGFKILSHSVRGNLIASIYTIWFYIAKIIFRKLHPRNRFLESLSTYSYNVKNGFIEHFIVAIKS